MARSLAKEEICMGGDCLDDLCITVFDDGSTSCLSANKLRTVSVSFSSIA